MNKGPALQQPMHGVGVCHRDLVCCLPVLRHDGHMVQSCRGSSWCGRRGLLGLPPLSSGSLLPGLHSDEAIVIASIKKMPECMLSPRS